LAPVGGSNPSGWVRMSSRDGLCAIIDRLGYGRRRAAVPILAFVVTALCGCTSSDGVGTFIVDPGHYSAYHCKDFGAKLTQLVAREQALRELMDKASEGSGGALIGNLTYRAEYEDVLGEEKLLRRSAAEKNCELPPPSVAVAPAAAPASMPAAVQPAAATPTSYQSDQTIR
jgi:hypothetical protein